ncbi:hypothetical protein GCM10020001_065410 [Nonomuraea salmonea]
MRQGMKDVGSNGRCSMATMKREVVVAGRGRVIFMGRGLRGTGGGCWLRRSGEAMDQAATRMSEGGSGSGIGMRFCGWGIHGVPVCG